MRVADQDYILALHRGERVVNYAVFTLHDGTILNLQPADFRVSGNSFTDRTTDGNSFSVGSFIGKTVNICIDNSTGKFDGYDFYMSRFVLRESIQTAPNTVKHVSIGTFTVVTDVTPGNVINFSGVDDSYLFDKPHNLQGTKTYKQIISQACYECLGSSTLDGTGNFDLYDTSIDTSNINENATWRQIVSYIAIATGYNAYIDVNEILKFKWYNTSAFEINLDGGTFDTNTTPYSDGDSADGGNFTNYNSGDSYDGGTFTDAQNYHIIQSYKNLQLGTYDISITGVRVVNGDTVVQIDSSTTYNYIYVIEIKDNPVCIGKENTIASHLAGKLLDFTFRNFSCDILCDPLIEAGDMAVVYDTKGIAHRTLINDVSFVTGGYTKIACKAEPIIRQQSSYVSEAAKALTEVNKQISRQITSYDESVQRMNRLAQNSLGLYIGRVELSDGSFINYESDHPITYWPDGSAKFTAGSWVSKDAGNGYFYSTYSGTSDLGAYPGSTATTWAGGMDRAGNAVMNTIAVYKIVADDALIGTIHDEQYINFLNLTTGDLRMTAGAKIRQTNPDYSGGYVPTNANAPALSWTTDELKQANVGKTFNNTSTTLATTYIYSVTEYPESAHPYNSSETAAYKFETGLTAPIKVVLNSQSKTESASYDWLDFFYTQSGTTYTRRIGGNIGGMEIIIPTSDFYLYWRTDGSVTDWGWKIDSIESTSGSPEGFSTTTLPSYSWTVVGGKYSWKEATLDNYVGGIASGIIPTGVELTQEEVFNALTNGQQDQGIYIYNGQVYLNASMMNTGYLSADLVNAGSLLADRIHGGTLVIGGDVSQDGKIYLVSNSSTLSTDTNLYSKTASFSYNYTGSLGKYAVSFVISGLSKNDVTFNYSIDMYRSGSSTEVSNGSFNMGAGTNVFTIPYEFDITSTSSSSLYFTIYIESVNSGGSSNKFNLSINYGKIITSLDKNGIKTTSLIADGDCTFGNLYIGKKTVSPWGANIETSYIYSTGYKEYFYRTWRSLKNERDYYYYFYVCPKADGWTSNCDINVYVNGDDTGSHTTAVYRVAKQTWNGSSWVESEYKTWDIDGDLKHGRTDYFTGFSASDSTTYRFEVKITGYSWASNYEVDIYTDPQHILELSNYGNTGSFNGQISGNGNFTNLSFGGFEFTDTQHKLINHSTYETFVMSNSAESVHVDIAYDNIRKNGTTPVMWDSSSDVRMKKNIHDLDVELSREIIDGTQPKSFEYIKEEGVHYGMIAQEARALLDSLGETDARLERTANMPDEETGIEDQRTIYYHEYIPHIINYIKRQEAEINELKAEIKALKGE